MKIKWLENECEQAKNTFTIIEAFWSNVEVKCLTLEASLQHMKEKFSLEKENFELRS